MPEPNYGEKQYVRQLQLSCHQCLTDSDNFISFFILKLVVVFYCKSEDGVYVPLTEYIHHYGVCGELESGE